MADGNLIANLIDRLPVPSVPRLPTADECFDEFCDEARERREATFAELLKDRETLQEIAAELLICFGKVKALHAKLGEAGAVTDRNGRTMYPALDFALYAVSDALFDGKLSPAADKLLTAELREAMA